MLRREQLDLGTNQHMVFNVDVGPVQEHAIEVDEDAFADMEVAAVIAIERRRNEASFINQAPIHAAANRTPARAGSKR